MIDGRNVTVDNGFIASIQGWEEEHMAKRGDYFEPEQTPTEPQTDTIWVLDGRGRMVELEVPDDADDD